MSQDTVLIEDHSPHPEIAEEATTLGMSGAASYLGINPSKLRPLAVNGIVPAEKSERGHWVFTYAELDNFAAQCRDEGVDVSEAHKHFAPTKHGKNVDDFPIQDDGHIALNTAAEKANVNATTMKMWVRNRLVDGYRNSSGNYRIEPTSLAEFITEQQASIDSSYSIKEATELLGTSPAKVRVLFAGGKVPNAFKTASNDWRVPKVDLDTFAETYTPGMRRGDANRALNWNVRLTAEQVVSFRSQGFEVTRAKVADDVANRIEELTNGTE